GLRMGTGHLRPCDPHSALAPEPERHAIEHPAPANPARADGGAGALQERSYQTTTGIDARIPGTRHEPILRAFGLSASADSDAGVLRSVFRVSEHDRVPRRAVPVALGYLASRPAVHTSDSDRRVDVPAVLDWHAEHAQEPPGNDD